MPFSKLLMRCCLLLCVSGLPFTALGQAQTARFNKYPVTEQYNGPQTAPKLKPGTAAWAFRTRIREAARQKPNFAGHYVLATWGCGAECLSYAIIDVKSGAVYFNDQTVCCWFTPGLAEKPESFEPVDFRINSRLVVFAGKLNEEGRNEPHPFKFEHGQLIAVQ